MQREEAVKKEISATARWGIGVLIGILIQSCLFIWWQSGWQARTEAAIAQNTKDIAVNKVAISAINTDIRDILIGIEQIKGRLGIIESDQTP